MAYDSKNTKSLTKTSRTISDSLLGDVISSWKSSENAFVCVFIREREREREAFGEKKGTGGNESFVLYSPYYLFLDLYKF